MKAILVSQTGGPDVLSFTDVPEPEPGPGQVAVAVAAAGVNFIDTYFRSGAYPRELPYIPGSEGAGTVSAVGAGVTSLAVGDAVAWCEGPGSYAPTVVLAANRVVAVPAGVEFDVAASTLLQGITAHYLLNSTYDAQPGETVLIHAGAGGVGLLMTQLARAKGLTTITTVSTDAKAELSRAAGADHVLRYHEVPDRVRELTDGEGVAAVYDGVGQDTFEGSLRSVRPRGTVALFGAASGAVPPFDLQRLNALGSLYVTRPSLGAYIASASEFAWRSGEVMDAVAVGTLRVSVGGRYRLADAAQAHTDLAARATAGAIVLLP